jgi:glucokinase
MILAGDVGGTKVALALVEGSGDDLRIRRRDRFETAAHDGLGEIARSFLERGAERPDRAAFGIAAPVLGRSVEMTNVAWTVDADALAVELGVQRVELLNDVAAAALGADLVAPAGLEPLREGRPRGSTTALIAAGTGLGAAFIARGAGGPRVFAPRTPLEDDLLAFLRLRFPDHVSLERVVSGPGILAIYEFLRDSGREEEPGWLAERLASSDDRGDAISRTALDDEAPICRRTIDVFAACYGAAAGDLALAGLALAGVRLGGGIARDILPLLRSGPFLEAFDAKGRMRDLLADVPVHVVVDPDAPILGAASWATLAEAA